jgi:hypothetical protein
VVQLCLVFCMRGVDQCNEQLPGIDVLSREQCGPLGR